MLDAQEGLEGDSLAPSTPSVLVDAGGSASAAMMSKRTRSASAAVVGTSHMAASLALSPPHARKSRDFLRFNSQSPSSSKSSKPPNGDDDSFSPTSLRDQCIYFIIAHSYALSPSASPFMSSSSNNNSRSRPQQRGKTSPSSSSNASTAAFSFLDSVSTFPSSSLPPALIRDLEEASRFYLSPPLDFPSSPPFPKKSRFSSRSSTSPSASTSSSSSSSPPSRSATCASLPTRGRSSWDLEEEATDHHDDVDDLYGPLATSSPIPLSLRQRASAAEPRPVDLGMAMLLSPPLRQQKRKTELVYRVVLVRTTSHPLGRIARTG
jgi:hypothetical protein